MTKSEDMLDGVIKALEREYDLLKAQENTSNGWLISAPSIVLTLGLIYVTIPNSLPQDSYPTIIFSSLFALSAVLLFLIFLISYNQKCFSKRIKTIKSCIQLLSLAKMKFKGNFSKKQKYYIDKIADDIISVERKNIERRSIFSLIKKNFYDAIMTLCGKGKYDIFLEDIKNDIREVYES